MGVEVAKMQFWMWFACLCIRRQPQLLRLDERLGLFSSIFYCRWIIDVMDGDKPLTTTSLATNAVFCPALGARRRFPSLCIFLLSPLLYSPPTSSWCLSHCCRALMQQFVFPAQPQTNSTRNSIVTSPKGTVPSSALVLQLCVHLCLVCLIHSEYEACTCVRVLFGLKLVLFLTRTFLPELVVKLSFLRAQIYQTVGYPDVSTHLNAQSPPPPPHCPNLLQSSTTGAQKHPLRSV